MQQSITIFVVTISFSKYISIKYFTFSFLLFWNEVLYFATEKQNQDKKRKQKDHVIEKHDVIGLTSLHTNLNMKSLALSPLGWN